MPIFPTGVFSATNPTPTTSRASGTTGPAEQVAALNGEVSAIENYLCGGHGNSVGVGIGALTSDTSGTATTVGYQAGAANTTGWITAFGYQALMSNTTGGTADEFSNTAVGINALKVNVTGASNTAIGGTSLESNSTGSANTACGSEALEQNQDGSWNTAVGAGALLYVQHGNGNVAVGFNALTGNTNQALNTANYNTAVGFEAFQSVESGGGVAVGQSAGTSLTTGLIVAIGALALQNAVSCTATAVGNGALTFFTTGYATAVGMTALHNLVSGDSVAIGWDALYNSTSGTNVAVGAMAGFQGGGGSNPTITGTGNTFIGDRTGPGNTSDPSYCTALGRYATCIGNGSVALGTDHTGAGAATTLQDQIMLGTANHTVYRAATNTASGATASTPTIANTATGVQVNATKDVMLYLTCSLAGTGFTLKIGPTSTPAYTIVSNVAVTIGDCFAVRVPGGWYVSWQATTATFANQQAVTC